MMMGASINMYNKRGGNARPCVWSCSAKLWTKSDPTTTATDAETTTQESMRRPATGSPFLRAYTPRSIGSTPGTGTISVMPAPTSGSLHCTALHHNECIAKPKQRAGATTVVLPEAEVSDAA